MYMYVLLDLLSSKPDEILFLSFVELEINVDQKSILILFRNALRYCACHFCVFALELGKSSLTYLCLLWID